MIAVNESTSYMPRLLMVNVRAGDVRRLQAFARARSVSSRRLVRQFGDAAATWARANHGRDHALFHRHRPRPMLISGLCRMPSAVQLAFIRGCFASVRATSATASR